MNTTFAFIFLGLMLVVGGVLAFLVSPRHAASTFRIVKDPGSDRWHAEFDR